MPLSFLANQAVCLDKSLVWVLGVSNAGLFLFFLLIRHFFFCIPDPYSGYIFFFRNAVLDSIYRKANYHEGIFKNVILCNIEVVQTAASCVCGR